MTYDIVVIGAGVIGSAVAYFAAERGLSVCLVEREGLGGRTTSASAGLTIVSSRVPGPALEFSLANMRLLGELRERFDEEIDYVQAGCAIVAEDAIEHDLLRRFVERQQAAVPVEFLEAEDLRRLEPGLSPHFLGASYCALDGYASPMGLAIAFARNARKAGADIRLRTEVVGVDVEGGRVVGVRTSAGRLGAQHVVNAAGVWSPEIARLAGLEVPVVPRKGQLLVSEPMPPLFRSVISHAGIIDFRAHRLTTSDEVKDELHKKRYMKQAAGGPFAGRVYIGSTSEFVGFDRSNTLTAVRELAQYAVETVPAVGGARLVRAWAGLRPRSADGKFIIGPAPGVEGFWIATGHDSNGVLHGSATGQMLAAWIATGQRPPLLAQFDPARLVRGAAAGTPA